MKKRCLLILSVFLLVSNAQAQTTVGGIIASNTSWTPSGNPYIVTSAIVINHGVTLDIGAGTILKFDGKFGMVIKGTLRAVGTEDSIIVFTSNKFVPAPGNWGSLHFNDEAEDYNFNTQAGSILQHCNILYPGFDTTQGIYNVNSAIDLQYASPFIDHCIIKNAQKGAISGSGGELPLMITNNKILDVQGDIAAGVLTIYSDSVAEISCNLFQNDIGNGVVQVFGKQCNFTNNIIINCSNQGGGLISNYSNGSFSNNQVIDNYLACGNLINNSGSITNNTITRNRNVSCMRSIVNTDSMSHFNHNNLYGNDISVSGQPYLELYNGVIRQWLNTPPSDATGNWWNKSTTSAINTTIYDYYDDTSKTIISYEPFLLSPDTLAPITPPSGVIKTDLGGGSVKVTWNPNPDADIAGYKIYRGSPTGYSFSNVTDVGNITSYILAGINPGDTIAVTAYDHLADGQHDQCDGNESWFTWAQIITSANEIVAPVNDVTLFPNPARDEFMIAFKTQYAALIQCRIYDIFGRIMSTKSIQALQGDNSFLVNVQALSNGLYTVELSDGNWINTSKVMIVR